jgi:hypothetical protein
MPFQKGTSGNIKGKPKGSVNKATTELRQWITAFINENKDQLQDDWKQLDPKDRIILFERLLKYSLPTLQATSLDFDFERLSEDQLDAIIDSLKQQHEAT